MLSLFLCSFYIIVLYAIIIPLKAPLPLENLLVLGHAKGVVATVEGNELGLEEDVTVDGEVRVATGLDTTEAGWKIY